MPPESLPSLYYGQTFYTERGLELPEPGEGDSPEEVVVAPSHNGRVCSIPAALKLVEDAVVLIQRAKLRPEVLVHCVRLNGLGLHVQVPDLDGEIVPAINVMSDGLWLSS